MNDGIKNWNNKLEEIKIFIDKNNRKPLNIIMIKYH